MTLSNGSGVSRCIPENRKRRPPPSIGFVTRRIPSRSGTVSFRPAAARRKCSATTPTPNSAVDFRKRAPRQESGRTFYGQPLTISRSPVSGNAPSFAFAGVGADSGRENLHPTSGHAEVSARGGFMGGHDGERAALRKFHGGITSLREQSSRPGQYHHRSRSRASADHHRCAGSGNAAANQPDQSPGGSVKASSEGRARPRPIRSLPLGR